MSDTTTAPATVRTLAGYRIIDSQTGQQIGKDYGPKAGSRATTRCDKLDLAYGAVRYRRQPIWVDVPTVTP